jgi:hypothetical protein
MRLLLLADRAKCGCCFTSHLARPDSSVGDLHLQISDGHVKTKIGSGQGRPRLRQFARSFQRFGPAPRLKRGPEATAAEVSSGRNDQFAGAAFSPILHTYFGDQEVSSWAFLDEHLRVHYVRQGEACSQHSYSHLATLWLGALFLKHFDCIGPAVTSDDNTSVPQRPSFPVLRKVKCVMLQQPKSLTFINQSY